MSPVPQNMNNNLGGADGTIPERDAELEQTGAYDYRGQPQHQQQNNLPPMTKTRQQEWEEAVELDRILEDERNAVSKATLARKQDNNFNEYMERLSNPHLKNQSSGLSGVLGGGSPSPYFNNAMGSLPDLKQSKRESKSSNNKSSSDITVIVNKGLSFQKISFNSSVWSFYEQVQKQSCFRMIRLKLRLWADVVAVATMEVLESTLIVDAFDQKKRQ